MSMLGLKAVESYEGMVLEALRTLARAVKLYLRNPNYRRFVKDINQGGLLPEDFRAYFGYGIYVGRKCS